VLVSHHVEEIPPGFSHVLMMRSGRITAQGLIDDTLTSANLSKTFGMPLELEASDGRYWAKRRARHTR